jgi:hypothetical protein
MIQLEFLGDVVSLPRPINNLKVVASHSNVTNMTTVTSIRPSSGELACVMPIPTEAYEHQAKWLAGVAGKARGRSSRHVLNTQADRTAPHVINTHSEHTG